MKILAEDLFPFLDMCFAARQPGVPSPAVKLESAPGAGKSKQVDAYAARKRAEFDGDYGLFVLDMSKANLADINGYLMPERQKHPQADGTDREIMAGEYTYPYFLYDKVTKKPAFAFTRGLIVLEEWGQGGGEEKKASAPIINDRWLGLWEFQGFDCIVLSNRPQDRSGVTKEYDFIINRWIEAELQPTLNGFLVAAQQLGMSTLTMAYAARNEDDLFTKGVPEKQGPWMTQRSLFTMDRVMRSAEAQGIAIESPLFMAAAAGAVGQGHATRFVAFANARTKIPTVSSIVANPEGAPIPSELDVMMFLVFDLASKTDRSNIEAIAKYVKRLHSDFSVTYFNAATRKDDTLVSTSEFTEFAVNNLTLLSAVAGRRK